MHKMFLLVLSLISMVSVAQVTVDDFESGNKGWVNTECYGDLVYNEYKSGINFSDHVYISVREPNNLDWVGALLKPYAATGYKYLHAYMYRNNTGVPNLKVSDTNPLELEPITTIVANQWQDVVWDISQFKDDGIEFIFFMVDRSAITNQAWMLIDEVHLSNDPTPRTTVVGGNSGSGTTDPTPVTDGEWKLVFEDHFNGTTLDTETWNIEVNGDGGGNNELQYYCEKGVSVQNGNLVLTATKENYKGKSCTSGRINCKHHTYFTYGRIEARIKMPRTANGLWPALEAFCPLANFTWKAMEFSVSMVRKTVF